MNVGDETHSYKAEIRRFHRLQHEDPSSFDSTMIGLVLLSHMRTYRTRKALEDHQNQLMSEKSIFNNLFSKKSDDIYDVNPVLGHHTFKPQTAPLSKGNSIK
jgi:hypothetical protein